MLLVDVVMAALFLLLLVDVVIAALLPFETTAGASSAEAEKSSVSNEFIPVSSCVAVDTAMH